MAKSNHLLSLEPPTDLLFKGPFTEVVTSLLKLTNVSEKPVCFKVKTTAPKMYCVRPNSGTIDPNASIDIAIMLQPFDYATLDKTKHKFMVQSIYAPSPPIDMEKLWKEADPNSIVNTKLKCTFELPGQESLPNKSLISSIDKSIYSPTPNEDSTRLRKNIEAETNHKIENDDGHTFHSSKVDQNEHDKQPREISRTRATQIIRGMGPNIASSTYSRPENNGDQASTSLSYHKHPASSNILSQILEIITNVPVLACIIGALIVGMIIAKIFF